MNGELDLWQYLEKREEIIVRRREELKVELEALRETRASLENTQRAKGGEDHKEKLTIKEMIRDVLVRNPEGGTSDQIIHWINQLHRVEVARTSLSPQLSRLKADNEVTLDESTGKWSLADAINEFGRRAFVQAQRSKMEDGILRSPLSENPYKRRR